MKCQLQLSPQCEAPEVVLDCPPYFKDALACVPCGKVFQQKYPHTVSGMTLRPLPKEATP